MKTKVIIITTLLLVSISTLIITVVTNNEKEESLSLIETKNMISYTLDGNKLNEKPTKESGYIANTISCENNTNIIWDNDNWEVEILNAESVDRCNIDFTKDNTKQGYRVNAVSNIDGSIDSLSKTTIKNGKVIFYSTKAITNVTGCTGVIEDNKVVVKNITSNQTCNITVVPPTLYDQILADHKTVKTRSNFDTVLGETTATTGVIYKEGTYKEDATTSTANNKDVYYFAGNVADNWVKFGGYYWRIIRTNEDGGIRLLYHGTSTTATDSYIQTSYAYNPTYNNTMYVGYMYGSTGSLNNNRGYTNSPQIKTRLESWYGTDLASYDSGVSKTAIYCNDRSGDAYAASGTMYYAAYKRLIDNKRPTYKCGGLATSTSLYGDANVADRFSKSTASGGNGKLSKPIGLMTADEVGFAGGVYGTNAPNTYYYRNSSGGSSTGSYWWWTMSPFSAISTSDAIVFYVSAASPGNLNDFYVGNDPSPGAALRPVISLKSCVTWKSGNGTAEIPYEIEVDSTCASLDN